MGVVVPMFSFLLEDWHHTSSSQVWDSALEGALPFLELLWTPSLRDRGQPQSHP